MAPAGPAGPTRPGCAASPEAPAVASGARMVALAAGNSSDQWRKSGSLCGPVRRAAARRARLRHAADLAHVGPGPDSLSPVCATCPLPPKAGTGMILARRFRPPVPGVNTRPRTKTSAPRPPGRSSPAYGRSARTGGGDGRAADFRGRHGRFGCRLGHGHDRGPHPALIGVARIPVDPLCRMDGAAMDRRSPVKSRPVRPSSVACGRHRAPINRRDIAFLDQCLIRLVP